MIAGPTPPAPSAGVPRRRGGHSDGNSPEPRSTAVVSSESTSPAPSDPEQDDVNVHPGPRDEGGAGGMATRELAEREHTPSKGRSD